MSTEINGKPATAFSLLAALVDIHDDSETCAPEHRCYVPSAWGEVLAEARAFIAAEEAATPSAPGAPQEAAENREIIATYDKLHAGKLGAHWLWCVIEQIAAGVPEVEAMRSYGYYEAGPSRKRFDAQRGAALAGGDGSKK